MIIIPYRNRPKQFEYFVKNTYPLITKYLPNTIFGIVEQNQENNFNRGKLINVAFNEFQNNSEYIITHDIDIIPKKDTIINLYTSKNKDIIRIFNGHDISLGGITKIKNKSFKKINGFYNDFWGWGAEDRDLFYRTQFNKINMTNNLSKKENFMFFEDNKKKLLKGKVKETSNFIDHIFKVKNNIKIKKHIQNGISSLNYKIIKRKQLNHNFYQIIVKL